ncbi:MAG: trigger factor [Gemmatimonadetes bacterium]|nr:trigger factor [Gemmatimonadota bacterium]
MSPLDASRLDVKVTEEERCRRTLDVIVPGDIIEEVKRSVTREYASRLKLKGFRKGKVPARVVVQRYGPVIEEEAVERSIRQACDGAISAQGLHPVSDVDVTDVRLDSGTSLAFKASFEVRPTIVLDRLGGFRVERPRADVPDEAVDRIIERLRGENAAWRTVENGRPEPGDSVTVVVTRLDVDEGEPDDADAGGRQYDLVLGQGQALPDIETAILGLTAGEGDDFDVSFPDDFPDPDRQGASHRLRIELLARRVPELPALDDGFARSLGDFEDVTSLKTRIGEDLRKEARTRAEAELNDRLMRLIVEANPFDVPDSIVEAYTDAVVKDAEGVDPEQLQGIRDEIRPASEFAVRRELVADRIVADHDLRPSEDEVGARVEALARDMGEPRGKVLARLRKSGGLRTIERQLTEARLFDFLRGRSDITDAP